MAGEGEGFDGSATGAGSVAVGHDVNGDAGLLFALRRHAGANLLDEPLGERGAGFNGAAAYNQSVRVKSIDHLVEEEPQRVGLHTEHFPGERVALVGETANELGGLMKVELGEFVTGIAREKKGENTSFDGGERTKGFEVADAAAIAVRLNAIDAGNASVGDENMAQFPAETVFALDHFAVKNDAATIAGTDDDGNGSFGAIRAEDGVMPPESGSVGVVEIRNRFAELAREAIANIETGPSGMNKVGGTSGAELASGAGGAGGIETQGDDVVESDTGATGGDLETISDLLKADVGALFGESGMLAETFDEKPFLLVEKGVVDRGSPEIDTGNDGHENSPRQGLKCTG